MMKRKIKFLYYVGSVQKKVADNKWKKIEKFSIEKWLKQFEAKYQMQKSIDIGSCKVRVDGATYNEEHGMWVFRFMKLRDDNIPSVAKDNTESHELNLDEDEYLGEDLFFLYDENNGISMIQVNRFSLGMIRFEEFLSFVWNIDGQRIKFHPILEAFDGTFFSSRKKYRTLEIRFANMHSQLEYGSSSLASIKKSFHAMGGITGSVNIGIGKSRNDTLNIDNVNDTIREALEDDEVVGMKLHYKDDDTRPIELIDLFDTTVHSYLSFNLQNKSVLNFTGTANEMIHVYINNKSKIAALLG